MKKILGLILLGLLFQCETEVNPELIFMGQIRSGDFSPTVPIPKIQVKISYYGDNVEPLETDSTLTDNFGNYSFETLDKNHLIKRYLVQAGHEYSQKCNYPGPQPIPAPFIFSTKEVDQFKINHDTLNVCVIGKIKLTFTKLNGPAKDTLTIRQLIKTNSNTNYIPQPISLMESKQWTEPYFSKLVTSIEYDFSLRKENGETTNWRKEQAVRRDTTYELTIKY